jgi:hypothetical protein
LGFFGKSYSEYGQCGTHYFCNMELSQVVVVRVGEVFLNQGSVFVTHIVQTRVLYDRLLSLEDGTSCRNLSQSKVFVEL